MADEVEELRGPPALHRTLDATAALQLVLLVVVWAASAALLWLVASPLEPRTGVSWRTVVAVWTASGLLTFVRPIEVVLGRLLLGLRAPTERQLAVIQPAWLAVCTRAGIRPDRYVVRVQHTGRVNATSAAGHLVGVTLGALGLPRESLEAVMAHELGHHVGGHAMIGLLVAWYGLPVRLLMRAAGVVATVLGRVASILRLVPSVAFLFLALALAVLSCIFLAFVPLVALPTAAFTIVGRRSELRADRTAVRLGYGPELVGLYEVLLASDLRPTGLAAIPAFFRETHPPFDARIRAIDKAVARGEAG